MSEQSMILNTYRVTEPTWFPFQEAVTGTVSTAGVQVTSIGGDFLTDRITQGDWLVNTNGNEARKVTDVYSATKLEIESPFTGDPIAGTTVVIVKDKAIRYLKVIFTGNDGQIRSANQATNAVWPVNQPWDNKDSDDFINPQLITPGSGGASVIFGV